MRSVLFILAALLVSALHGQGTAQAVSRWEEQVSAIEATRRESPAPENPILFIGSSSIRGWRNLASDFPDLPVINHGFGGSQISDAIDFFDRLVRPFKPRLVVFYSGTNDLASAKTAEAVAADFRTFCERLHAEFPETRILFIGLVMAPARWELRKEMALTNALVAAYCAADPRRDIIDMNPLMMSPEGEARPELYIKDQLHMNRAGYQIWQRALDPLIR